MIVLQELLLSNNKEYCISKGLRYISMAGNKGLSKAYNAAIDACKDKDVIIFFDDDTEVTEEYLDEYLNAEGRDKLKIKHLFENAVNYVMVVNGYTEVEQLEESEYLTDVVLMRVQQMYDNGYVESNKEIDAMMTMDRRF